MLKVLPSLSIVTFKAEELNKLTPVKSLPEMLVMYADTWLNSELYRVRSASDLVTSCSRIGNSLIRSNALLTFDRKPSSVWANEMALPTLLLAAWVRPTWASNLIDTAKPAASSAGEVILEPDDRRDNDLASIFEDSFSKSALFAASMLVLITITAKLLP